MKLIIILYMVGITFGHFVKEVKTENTLEPQIKENEEADMLQESIQNGESQISDASGVITAAEGAGAVITVPPTNQTKLEGDKIRFICEGKAESGNLTVRWFHEGAPIKELNSLERKVTIREDGWVFINPVNSDDSGKYTCEVSNGVGEPQSASAYLNVEYPAKVALTPTTQYLPLGFAGVLRCYVKANPPIQYIAWTKNKHLLDPYLSKEIAFMNNGSIFFGRVNHNDFGTYTCIPYNDRGTQGASDEIEVLVQKPPEFTIKPQAIYRRKVGETVEMHCEAQEGEDTQKPTIEWQRRDGKPLPKHREIVGGNITIENLTQSDFGFYHCVASNEVTTIVASTQLVIEGTYPFDPYSFKGTALEFAVTLSWLPVFDKQNFTVWYREVGAFEWSTRPVTPSGSTQIRINCLTSATIYEFRLVGRSVQGDAIMSEIITVRTLGKESLSFDGN